MTIVHTTQFKKDFKLIKKRGYDLSKLSHVLELLLQGEVLPPKYKEHPLKGGFIGVMDCHIEPDWILLFRRDKAKELIELIRTGTHSDLFR